MTPDDAALAVEEATRICRETGRDSAVRAAHPDGPLFLQNYHWDPACGCPLHQPPSLCEELDG